MRKPAYKLHQIVYIDPVGDEKGGKAKIIAVLDFGSHYEYLVSGNGKYGESITRHQLHEEELSPCLVPVDFTENEVQQSA